MTERSPRFKERYPRATALIGGLRSRIPSRKIIYAASDLAGFILAFVVEQTVGSHPIFLALRSRQLLS